MLRRTSLMAVGVVLLLIGAVAASGRSSADDPYVGSWSVANRPGDNQNTPWKNGGTFTVKVAQRSEVEAYKDVSGPGGGNSGIRSSCVGYGYPPTDPVVSVWYLASYSWGGTDGTMAGCISDRTDGLPEFSGQGTAGELQSGPSACGPVGTCLTGYWTDRSGPYLTFAASHGSAGTTETAFEPNDSGVIEFNSPELPKAAEDVDMILRNAAGNFHGDMVATEGEVHRRLGELVAACWLTYDFTNDAGQVYDLTPNQQLQLCLFFIRNLFKKLGGSGPPIPARRMVQAHSASTATGCKTKRLAVAVKMKKGKVLSVKRAQDQRLRPAYVRYSCSVNAGVVTLKASATRPLRNLLGKKLQMGIYRAPKAPKRKAKLSITFGWK